MKRNRDENIDRVRAYDRERSKTPKRKLLDKKKQKRKRDSDKNYCMAHNKLLKSVASGEIIRPDHCSVCLVNCKPQAHHDDYSKPLDVIWLCPICHADRHRQLGRLGRETK
jgi:hypothetical protein